MLTEKLPNTHTYIGTYEDIEVSVRKYHATGVGKGSVNTPEGQPLRCGL